MYLYRYILRYRLKKSRISNFYNFVVILFFYLDSPSQNIRDQSCNLRAKNWRANLLIFERVIFKQIHFLICNLSIGRLRVVGISGSSAESILIRVHDETGDSYPFVHSGYWILSFRSNLPGSRLQQLGARAIRIGSLSLLERSLSAHSVGNGGDLAIIGSICVESPDGCRGNSPEHGDGRGRRSNHTLITYNPWST